MTTSLALAALGMIAVVGAVLTGCENKNEAQDGSPRKGPSNQNRPERPSDSPSKRPSSSETSSSGNSSSSSVPTEFPVVGDEFVSNDPTTSEEEKVGKPPKPFIQNKTHWCYATCAIILADGQYKPDVAAGLEAYQKKMELVENRNYVEMPDASMAESVPENEIYTNGMREFAVGYEPGYGYYCDPTQEYIATYHSYDSDDNIKNENCKCKLDTCTVEIS